MLSNGCPEGLVAGGPMAVSRGANVRLLSFRSVWPRRARRRVAAMARMLSGLIRWR